MSPANRSGSSSGAAPGAERDSHDDAESIGDLQAGDSIGGYELLELIGRGGAASVFSARRTADGGVVALKVLASSKLGKPRVVQRFRDEARTLATVKHPTLVELHELIEAGASRRLAYAMELVRGRSLREHLDREGVLPLQEAIHIAQQVCSGVEALHRAGVIHRDLKPENIMLVAPDHAGLPWRVKVLDFGVAMRVGELEASAESPGSFVGTPRYMAPEQAAGGAVDARSDLFAIGVMLFEMITGKRPHEGESLKAVVMAKLKGAPRLLMNRDQELLPMELADAVDACLKLQPDLRPKDARSLIRILEDAQAVLAVVGPVRLDPSRGLVRSAAGSARPAGASTPPPPVLTPAPEVVPSEPAVTAVASPWPARALLLGVAVAGGLIAFALVLVLSGRSEQVVLPVPPAPPAPVPVVQLLSVPVGATVEVGDRVVGPTPQHLRVADGERGLEVRLSFAGYQAKRVRLTGREQGSVLIALDRAPTSTPAAELDAGSREAPNPKSVDGE
ncbi:MAG: serine/threonine protein kinase [Deltaproteobacteria bacterium]|nr:serine/threonine protein kinase [Deltaproteobacteria bacterium]